MRQRAHAVVLSGLAITLIGLAEAGVRDGMIGNVHGFFSGLAIAALGAAAWMMRRGQRHILTAAALFMIGIAANDARLSIRWLSGDHPRIIEACTSLVMASIAVWAASRAWPVMRRLPEDRADVDSTRSSRPRAPWRRAAVLGPLAVILLLLGARASIGGPRAVHAEARTEHPAPAPSALQRSPIGRHLPVHRVAENLPGLALIGTGLALIAGALARAGRAELPV